MSRGGETREQLFFSHRMKTTTQSSQMCFRELQKWWGRYMESIGEMEGAKNFYLAGGDHLSVVRILCMTGKTSEVCFLHVEYCQAADIANESGDKAACYHLARHYEGEGDVRNVSDTTSL